MNKDLDQFIGHAMYDDDKTNANPFTTGWSIGQRVPGWFIDSAAINNLDFFPQSRWDINSSYYYEYVSKTYTLIMNCNLNTGNADDLNMTSLDSVNMKIGVLDNHSNITTASMRRYFTERILAYS